MTPRTLFTIILRIIGLFYIKDILKLLPELAILITSMANANNFSEIIGSLVSFMLVIFILVVIVYFLIFKTEFLIDKLKLHEGFEQDSIPLNLHRSSILSISIIVIWGLIITDQLPNLFRHLITYFQQKSFTRGMINPNVSYSILAASKIFVGLILVVYQRTIVNFIEYKQRNKTT